MSSPQAVGRHYAGRHSAGRHRPTTRRLPSALSGGFVLPTAAAATLVLTATGASVAESRGLTSSGNTAAAAAFTAATAPEVANEQAMAAVDDASMTSRRAAAGLQKAALAGRQQEAARVAREKARVALAAKKAAEAKAKLEASGKFWVMPVKNYSFTSGFKWRWGRMHTGNDLAAPSGTPIMAMSKGVVTFTGWSGGAGQMTKIEYWDGTVSYYEHQSRIVASVGQQVMPGDVVGYVGNTGHSFGAHLHLEIHPGGGEAVDPTPWLADHGLKIRG